MIPLMTFALSGCLTLWLWDRHAGVMSTVGEVQAQRFSLTSRTDGVLATLERGAIQRFDQVEAGQIIARLDSRLSLALLEALYAEVAQSKAKLYEAAVDLGVARDSFNATVEKTMRRLSLQVERARLEILEHEAQLAVARLDLNRCQERYEHTRRLFEDRKVTADTLSKTKSLRDAVADRIEERLQVIEGVQSQLKARESRLGELSHSPDEYLETVLAPIRANTYSYLARMRDLLL